MILRNVGILSCGKMGGAIGVGLGLMIGGFISVMTIVGTVLGRFAFTAGTYDVLFTWAAFLSLPVVYGATGVATGIVSAFSYNLASSRLGGVELDIIPPAQ